MKVKWRTASPGPPYTRAGGFTVKPDGIAKRANIFWQNMALATYATIFHRSAYIFAFSHIICACRKVLEAMSIVTNAFTALLEGTDMQNYRHRKDDIAPQTDLRS
jgi:hypothetical protein